MKSLIKAVAIAVVLAAPVVSFAQSSQQPVTRAEVRGQLSQLEQAGYNPANSSDSQYPSNVQAAEQRVEAQNPAVAQTQEPVADTSYGGVANGSSQSGAMAQPQPTSGPKSVYFGN